MKENIGKFLIYQNEKGNTKVDVYFQDGNIWMTQSSLAVLYQTTPQNITLHIKNIYLEGELLEEATCKEYLQVQIVMHMADWEAKLNDFLRFTGREILLGAGSISADLAKKKAETEYEKYDLNRKQNGEDISILISDVKRINSKKKK